MDEKIITKKLSELDQHLQKLKNITLQDLFTKDDDRFSQFSLETSSLFIDFSKNHLTFTTLKLLCDLARTFDLPLKIEEMFTGKKINTTEDRAVLHTALRSQEDRPIYVNDEDILPKIRAIKEKTYSFSEKVQNGDWLGFSGQPIKDVVNIGIGGSDLGPKMVCEALDFYKNSPIESYFISNVDSTQITQILAQLDPQTTLFIISSKTFKTVETLTNANSAKRWLLNACGNDTTQISKHFVAISTNREEVVKFGIDSTNMFEFWDWVGGRYSIWSAIGLPIILKVGKDNFEKFLQGAADMDNHFRKTDLEKNIPVILALIDIWYRNFWQTTSHAIIPYDQYLQYLPAYLQQLEMESNGKSVNIFSKKTRLNTAPVIWGGIGTDGQHAFHQLLHQGSDLIPIDFIVAQNSLNLLSNHHQLLYANCLAQSEALLMGKTFHKIYEELQESSISKDHREKLALHKEMKGNRPSTTIVLARLTPRTLGALLALYEHKVFVEGVIWQINSFDQWGVELGKELATKILSDLSQVDNIANYDSSTRGLIKRFKQYHKRKD